jgi:hypothetical protein
METKTFPAFGFYVVRNRISAGEVISDDVFFDGKVKVVEPFDVCWLYTKGLVHNINIDTQEVSVRMPGFCNAVSKEKSGTWRADFLQDSTVFCLPPQRKDGSSSAPALVDLVSPFVLPAGQTTNLPQGTKLSLCQGRVSINGSVIPELRQIEVKTGERVVTAVEDSFGFIFP